MENNYWELLKNALREFFDFLIGIDQQTTAIVEDGMRVVWEDVRSFFTH